MRCRCSNSSSFKSSEMLEKVSEAGRKRVLNTHYMMPPDTRVVELMTCGSTDPDAFPFLVEQLKEVAMHPIVAQKESTGFVFNRLWAAIKRETLSILAEGVSTPKELDSVWIEMYGGGKGVGPCAMMDGVGLDTVAFIEEHYVEERHLSSENTVDFLKQNYLTHGKLGAKSDKGGLYSPEDLAEAYHAHGEESIQAHGAKSHHDADTVSHEVKEKNEPTLFFLDLGLLEKDPLHSGRILSGTPNGAPLKTLVSGQALPDGLGISKSTRRIYWTNMGVPNTNDGTVQSCKLDGSDVQIIVPAGGVHTPKQLIVHESSKKLYFSDREGMRVMRCNFDGSELETLIVTGDFNNDEHMTDQPRWCVGVSVSDKEGKFYWTQKGGSKAGNGRIFRANIEMPKGKDAASRDDIEMVFEKLPECIDLDIDNEAGILYWSDRGDPPTGNSLNRVELRTLGGKPKGFPDYEILARSLHEAIGVALDPASNSVYTTDLGGTVCRFDMKGKNKVKIYDDAGAFSGIAVFNEKA